MAWLRFRVLALAALLLSVAAVSAQAQSSRGAVKIGVLNDMAGPYADITGRSSLLAVQMAVEDFGGAVLGRKVEVVSADHQNKPDFGLAIARQWYDQEGVGAIIGVGSSAVALAIRSYAREHGKIDIYTTTGTSDLTDSACSPTGFHWMHDTYALAKVIATAGIRNGGDTWHILAADYAFGHVLERDVTRFVTDAGGRVFGSVRHPVNSSDFSSFLLQAQASGAKIIALANGGADLVNSVKTAREFGIIGDGSKQSLAVLLLMITDVKAIGLAAAQGLLLTEGFYWDRTDDSRAWSKRFFARRALMPNQMNAADCSAALHYLKAVQAAGTDEPKAVAVAMRRLPINDFTLSSGSIRSDGSVERDMYLFRAKKPSESRSEWDLYDLVATVPFEDAFRPLPEGGCASAGGKWPGTSSWLLLGSEAVDRSISQTCGQRARLKSGKDLQGDCRGIESQAAGAMAGHEKRHQIPPPRKCGRSSIRQARILCFRSSLQSFRDQCLRRKQPCQTLILR